MTHIHDTDTLLTQTPEDLYIDLICGYGQPCETTVYLKKPGGITENLAAFGQNASALLLGKVDKLRFHTLEVHTTIHDVRDNAVEGEDISLRVKIYETNGTSVETGFTRKTKGKGSVFHSFYVVTII